MAAIAEAGGRIGPNAITRLAQAAEGAMGREATRGLFSAAGLDLHLASPPQHMVPERDVTALHRALRERVGAAQAALLAREAGHLTAEYLLANRIPRPVQWLQGLHDNQAVEVPGGMAEHGQHHRQAYEQR